MLSVTRNIYVRIYYQTQKSCYLYCYLCFSFTIFVKPINRFQKDGLINASQVSGDSTDVERMFA